MHVTMQLLFALNLADIFGLIPQPGKSAPSSKNGIRRIHNQQFDLHSEERSIHY
jgi:hypothetical protein